MAERERESRERVMTEREKKRDVEGGGAGRKGRDMGRQEMRGSKE